MWRFYSVICGIPLKGDKNAEKRHLEGDVFADFLPF
jgi:hypothetical protein